MLQLGCGYSCWAEAGTADRNAANKPVHSDREYGRPGHKRGDEASLEEREISEIAQRVSRIEGRPREGAVDRLERVGKQREFVGPMAINGRPGHRSTVSDRLDGQTSLATVAELLERRAANYHA